MLSRSPLSCARTCERQRMLWLRSYAGPLPCTCELSCMQLIRAHQIGYYAPQKSETGIGGVQNVPNARGGGNSPRKLPLENLDFSPPNWRFFLEIQNFHPPSNFRRFDLPYPGLQKSITYLKKSTWIILGITRARSGAFSNYFWKITRYLLYFM